MFRPLLILVLLAFSVLTGLALWHHGVLGIFEPVFQSFGAAQIFVDLVIALTLVLVWLWRDARSRGRSPWPWVALTLAAGSFGPLIYLLLRGPDAVTARPAASRPSAGGSSGSPSRAAP